ncbi:prolipoprotein diacylglyceryl transferase [Colletotrichum higginsianum]|nr:prolipoprotein diacylglyceryl transferase [Colletotrichum higginsianum]
MGVCIRSLCSTVGSKTYIFDAGLQKPPGLEAGPDDQHAEVAVLGHLGAALGAQLAQDGQGAAEQVHVRVQAASDALEQEDADDDVDEVALEADVVAADHAEHLLQDVADADVAEGEGAALDAEDEVLHLEGEDVLVEHGVGLAAALAHELAGLVAVELGDGAEEVEEVCAVRLVELRHETRVDEDQLRPEALVVDAAELGGPGGRVLSLAVGAQPGEDLLRDVVVAALVARVLPATVVPLSAELDFGLVGLVEAHHDVARVEEGVEALGGDVLLEDAAAVLEEVGQRDALGKLLDQDAAGGELGIGVREPGGGAVAEVLAELCEVGGLDAKVELELHHLAELGDLVGQREPLDGRDEVEARGEEVHDAQVAADGPFDAGVQHLDGDVGRGDPPRGALEGGLDVLGDLLAERFGALGGDVIVARRGEVGLQLGAVDLSYGTDAQRRLVELVKDVVKVAAVEGGRDDAFGLAHRVGRGVGVQLRHDLAHLVGEDVGARGGPLTELQGGRGPGPFHGLDQEAIPPQRAAAFIVTIGLPLAQPEGGDSNDNGHKDDDEVEEAQAGAERLPQIDVHGDLEGMPDAQDATVVIGHLLLDLGAADLEHALLARLVGALVVLLRQFEEGGRPEGGGTGTACSQIVFRVSIGPPWQAAGLGGARAECASESRVELGAVRWRSEARTWTKPAQGEGQSHLEGELGGEYGEAAIMFSVSRLAGWLWSERMV